MRNFVDEKISTTNDVELLSVKWSSQLQKFIKSIIKGKEGEVITPSPKLQVLFKEDRLVLKHNNSFWVFSKLGSRQYKLKNDDNIGLLEFSELIKPGDFKHSNQAELKGFLVDFSDEGDPWTSLIRSHLTSLKFS